tara:strand:- start:955 stop:1167 length:213 start_codon:yes stop_codon:yes gene_type:complete
MGIISREVTRGKVDWPQPNCLIAIEENPGDDEHIHIHIHNTKECGWAFRLHFTYDEFKEFAEAIMEGGEL